MISLSSVALAAALTAGASEAAGAPCPDPIRAMRGFGLALDWERTTDSRTQTGHLLRPVSRKFSMEAVGEIALKGSTEDRELGDQYIFGPRLHYRLVSCELESLEDAWSHDSTARAMWLIPAGSGCYRLFWGHFSNEREARRAVRSIPLYFRSSDRRRGCDRVTDPGRPKQLPDTVTLSRIPQSQ